VLLQVKKQVFDKIAYTNLNDFVYGKAPNPVTLKNGMVIGGGTVYPEVNFTLPNMLLRKETWPDAVREYKDMITGICERAKYLDVPGFSAEIETLPPMTDNPEFGEEVCKTVVDVIKEHEAKHGIKGAVRITPNDVREGKNLKHLWSGPLWENTLKTFEKCAKVGASFLAIETLAAKEIHDEGAMYCDIAKCILAQGVLGARDMDKIWTEIVKIADATGAVPAGDTACGFANTAMVLACQGYIPRIFGAACRVIACCRNLEAIEAGARGPHKDCGYEGPYVKCITGTPIASEGRLAAVAHLSTVGNIACCECDLWSNESVANIRLLGGMAPTCCFEMLAYDCRLFNTAAKQGKALVLRDLYADSDSYYDPHAYILRPEIVYQISQEIVKEKGSYARSKKAAACVFDVCKKAHKDGKLLLDAKELKYLDELAETVDKLPADEGKFYQQTVESLDDWRPQYYEGFM